MSDVYNDLISKIFFSSFAPGKREIQFTRDDIREAADDFGMTVPKNIGDVVYAYRSERKQLPDIVQKLAPVGMKWVIRLKGRGIYTFEAIYPLDLSVKHGSKAIKMPVQHHLSFENML